MLLRRPILGLLALTCACVPEPSLPPCVAVTDCPLGQGWLSCQDGLCFRFGGTSDWEEAFAPPKFGPTCQNSPENVPNDGCCPGRSMTAEGDPECLAGEVTVSGATSVGDPAVQGEVVWFVARTAGETLLARVDTGAPLEATTRPIPGASPPAGVEAPVVAPDGTILVARGDGLCHFNASGVLLRACEGEGAQGMMPQLLANGRVLTVDPDGKATLRSASGETVGTVDLAVGPTGSAAAPDGQTAYVAATAGGLWAVGPDGAASALAVRWHAADADVAGPLAVDDGHHVFFATSSGRIRAVTDAGKSYSAATDLDDNVAKGALVLDSTGRILAASPSGGLTARTFSTTYFLKTGTGAVATVFDGAPVVTEGDRVFLTGNGALHRFDPGDAGLSPAWRWSGLGPAVTAMNVTRDGRLVLGRQPDRLVVLTPGLGTLAAGIWPRPRRDAASSASFLEYGP